MISRMRMRDERGITALETAIILIAFVVVASVLAFTILSSGTYTTERSKEAIYAGLEEVRSTMGLKGSMIAEASAVGASGVISQVTFTMGAEAGGEAIDLTLGADQRLVVDYRDASNIEDNVAISVTFTVGDSDSLLEDGELAKFIVPLNGQTVTGQSGTSIDVDLGTNETFALEVKPPAGAVIILERTTPPSMDLVMDLH